MTTIAPSYTSRGTLWTSYILSRLPVLFLLFDMVGKFLKPQPVIDASTLLGFTEAQIPFLASSCSPV